MSDHVRPMDSFSTATRHHPPQHQQPQLQQNRIYFLTALESIAVPSKFLRGIEVVAVSANGKTRPALLRISADRFTIHILPVPGGVSERSIRSSGFFSRRSTSGGSASDNSSVATSQSTSTASSRAEWNAYYNTHSAVDIGEIYRIQRGQSTQQFEKAKKISETTATKINKNNNMLLTAANIDVLNNSNSNKFEAIARRADLLRISGAGGHSISSRSLSHLSGCDSTVASTAFVSSQVNTNSSNGHQLDPQLSFSIVFRGAQTLDLMAPSGKDREEICDLLDRILLAYQRGKTRVSADVLLLRYLWLDVDKDKAGYVTCTQFANVLDRINFAVMKPRDLANAYEKFGKVIGLDRSKRKKGLTFEQSATFLHKIKRDSWMVKPIKVIWNELFGEVMNNGKERLSVSDKTFLDNFLKIKQGQTATTLTDVKKIFIRLHDMEFAHTSTLEPKDINRINRDQFEAYLLGNDNDAFDPDRSRQRLEDMNQPLSEYWISSSHNTYLIGDQYTSHSSVEMYSNALYRGARCLELDIWDGGKSPNGSPIPVVWHGHTMTTKILFVEIIKTIKVFLNFHPDTYPIILSFENHCSFPYQVYMAEQLQIILGDSLYVPTEASLFGQLPTPLQLRGMVVIKGRRPLGTEADQYDSDDYYIEGSDEEGVGNNNSTSGVDRIYSSEARAQVVKHGVAPELASLTLLHGHKLKSFEESIREPTYYMHSFSESYVRSLCRSKKANNWIRFNQSHLSRTYPAGSRVDSSNYSPLLAWSTGCQMVALNFQTQDVFLKLNDGRFRENGNCGYVLKPSSLMTNDSRTQKKFSGAQLTIRVLSGHCLPNPNGAKTGVCIDPYVKIAVYDVNSDDKQATVQYVTNPVPGNGYFPIWGQEKFRFSIENWAVAMLQVTVHDKQQKGDDLIASSSIPISCLQRGIRCVKLYDSNNTRSGAFDFASLLLDIKMGQKVSEI